MRRLNSLIIEGQITEILDDGFILAYDNNITVKVVSYINIENKKKNSIVRVVGRLGQNSIVAEHIEIVPKTPYTERIDNNNLF